MERATSRRTTDVISLQVVDALATAVGTDPIDMEPPLFDVINPEALDRLFRADAECRVRFEYEGHSVEVRNDGTVVIDGTTPDRL